jgi:hypothetical protein
VYSITSNLSCWCWGPPGKKDSFLAVTVRGSQGKTKKRSHLAVGIEGGKKNDMEYSLGDFGKEFDDFFEGQLLAHQLLYIYE